MSSVDTRHAQRSESHSVLSTNITWVTQNYMSKYFGIKQKFICYQYSYLIFMKNKIRLFFFLNTQNSQ